MGILELWLPILVTSVVMFFVGFIAWTVSPHHKKDWVKLPNEDDIQKTVRSGNIKPGQYIFPHCADWSELKDPEKKARYEAGPHGTVTVWAGPPAMGKSMALTFFYQVVVSVFIGYLTSLALGASAEFSKVFQVAGTAGILAHCFASIPNAIWFCKPLRAIMTDLIDGVIYGLLTGVIFAWLWPS